MTTNATAATTAAPVIASTSGPLGWYAEPINFTAGTKVVHQSEMEVNGNVRAHCTIAKARELVTFTAAPVTCKVCARRA